jgi:hypothetical protein
LPRVRLDPKASSFGSGIAFSRGVRHERDRRTMRHKSLGAGRRPRTRILSALAAAVLLCTSIQVVVAAPPSADLDQCGNGPLAAPTSCNPTIWQNGNLNGNQAHYSEGDSVPYRIRFANLPLASHTVIIEWDTTKSGKHALDYLTTFDRTVGAANPCAGVAACGAPTTFAIPADPQVTGAGVTPVAGNFTLYGGTISSVSAYGYPLGSGFSGDKSARIAISFNATTANPVLAWGGHIATRLNWGANLSAVSIAGSPFHMRLIDLDGKGGNQDRSLSNDAVTFPGSITVIKDANPNGSTPFSFTGSPSPLANFSLVDDGTPVNYTKAFTGITTFQTYTVNETPIPTGWGFDGVSCSAGGTLNGGSATPTGASVAISMKEGENWTCTYRNSRRFGTLVVQKIVAKNDGGTAVSSDWSIHVKSGGSEVGGSPQAGSSTGTSYSLDAGGYVVTETGGPSGYSLAYSGDCDASGNVTVVLGVTKTCTLTNSDDTPTLKLVKTVDNTNGGGLTAADFTLHADAAAPNDGRNFSSKTATPIFHNVFAGAGYVLSEDAVVGYTAGTWSCDKGGALSGSTVTLALGDTVTCTLNNADDKPQLRLVKDVRNNDGGALGAGDFNLKATAAAPKDGRNFASKTATPAFHDVIAGAGYVLSEDAVTGYTAGTWSCDKTGVLSGSTVTLALGDLVTCTLINTDNTPSLKLVKQVTNDDGGTLGAGDFNLKAASSGGDATRDFASKTSTPTFHAVFAGGYALSEDAVTGYTAGSWSCDKTGALSGSTVTIALGDSVTCTLTNDDNGTQLKLVKVVDNNDGGALGAGDFNLKATSSGADATRDFASKTASPVFHNVFAGAGYALSEDGLTGYTAGTWSCDKAGALSGSSVTLALGDSVTCTLHNTDNTPQLKLVKEVTNDNGGTLGAGDFTLRAESAGADASRDFSSKTASPVFHVVFAAVGYDLSEDAVADYTAGTWSCDKAGALTGSTVTLALGDSVTCTLTNDDDKASPDGSTVQTWIVKDSITITGIRAGSPAPAASVTFTLYSDDTCTTVVDSQVDGSIVAGVASTPTGIAVTDEGIYYWIATYSGDQYNTGFSTECGAEVTQILALDATHSGFTAS